MNPTPRIVRATPWREAVPRLALTFVPAVIALALGRFMVFPWIRVYLEAAQSRTELIGRVELVFAGFAISPASRSRVFGLARGSCVSDRSMAVTGRSGN